MGEFQYGRSTEGASVVKKRLSGGKQGTDYERFSIYVKESALY